MSDLGCYAEGKRTPGLPVLFLDVDGVLNCEQDFRYGYMLCQRKVRMLNELPPCDIVISSAWRIGTYPHLVAALRWLGCKKPVVGHTPSLSLVKGEDGEHLTRGAEIEDWLGRNGRPRFAIVDDDSDMLPHQRPYFVHTTFKHGLLPEHVAALARLLKDVPREVPAGNDAEQDLHANEVSAPTPPHTAIPER